MSSGSPGASSATAKNPLLVSVRSGARASMPGMMDTVLNLGLNDVTVEALAKSSGDARFAYDSYRRFITMYSDVVLGVGHDHFEEILEGHKDQQRLHARHRSDCRRLGRADQALQGARQGRDRRGFSAGPAEAAVGRDRRGVRIVDERARQHLSPPAQHSGKLGHRRQRAGDGVRQHGRHVGDRRCVHAQSLDRRDVRSTANSSSTRRARTWSPASARRRRSPRRRARRRARTSPRWNRRCRRPTRNSRASISRSRSTTATCRTSNSRSRRASCGCCRRAPASAPPRRRCASRSSLRARA